MVRWGKRQVCAKGQSKDLFCWSERLCLGLHGLLELGVSCKQLLVIRSRVMPPRFIWRLWCERLARPRSGVGLVGLILTLRYCHSQCLRRLYVFIYLLQSTIVEA